MNKFTDEQWLDIFQQCKASGISDLQWCRENNIAPSTFYYRLNRVRKETSEPVSEVKTMLPEYHEVVPLIVCDEEELHRVYAFDDETQNAAVNSSTSASTLSGMMRKRASSTEKAVERETASSCHIGARIITEIISEKVKTSIGGSNHVTFSQFVNTYLKKLIMLK